MKPAKAKTPKVADMRSKTSRCIMEAIRHLKEREGSSMLEIKKWLSSNHQGDIPTSEDIKLFLKQAADRGTLVQSGRKFKIAEKAKSRKVTDKSSKRLENQKSEPKNKTVSGKRELILEGNSEAEISISSATQNAASSDDKLQTKNTEAKTPRSSRRQIKEVLETKKTPKKASKKRQLSVEGNSQDEIPQSLVSTNNLEDSHMDMETASTDGNLVNQPNDRRESRNKTASKRKKERSMEDENSDFPTELRGIQCKNSEEEPSSKHSRKGTPSVSDKHQSKDSKDSKKTNASKKRQSKEGNVKKGGKSDIPTTEKSPTAKATAAKKTGDENSKRQNKLKIAPKKATDRKAATPKKAATRKTEVKNITSRKTAISKKKQISPKKKTPKIGKSRTAATRYDLQEDETEGQQT